MAVVTRGVHHTSQLHCTRGRQVSECARLSRTVVMLTSLSSYSRSFSRAATRTRWVQLLLHVPWTVIMNSRLMTSSMMGSSAWNPVIWPRPRRSSGSWENQASEPMTMARKSGQTVARTNEEVDDAAQLELLDASCAVLQA